MNTKRRLEHGLDAPPADLARIPSCRLPTTRLWSASRVNSLGSYLDEIGGN